MDLSIIILNFNTYELTQNCISSILKNTKNINFEIVLLDNGSFKTDKDKLEKFSKNKPKIVFIRSKKNLGFGGGNNFAAKKARGRYVVYLNSDTLIEGNVLGEMVMWMDENEDIGISTCSLLYEDGRIQGTGGYFPTLPRVLTWMLMLENIPLVDKLIKPFHPLREKAYFSKGKGFYKVKKDLDWVTGAFMLVRKSVVNRINGFDTDYFMYTEDTDYCFRAKLLGVRVVYNPKWSIVHLGGASSAAEFPIVSEFDGLKTFYRKNMKAWKYPLLILLLKTGALTRVAVLGTLRGSEYAKTYIKAFKQA